MKKHKSILLWSTILLILGLLGTLLISFWDRCGRKNYLIGIMVLLLVLLWCCGSIPLLFRKNRQGKVFTKLLIVGNTVSLCILLCFGCFYLLATNHAYAGDFSITTSLFAGKDIMVIVPHQDDDINLMGGLIEQYTQSGSEVSVVFTTNGDGDLANADIRAAEVVDVLTALGVKKENIYYLGFGDLWQAQTVDGREIRHIYNSTDPDAVWTSSHGATATYDTQSIPCYLELPYTRRNYLHSLEMVIQEKLPGTIFAVDFDAHIDHKATDLFFEEALCNVLKNNPEYHPTVYKGFCYGTAWKAEDDYYVGLNLLSSKKPDDYTWNASAFGYDWEDRVRFPISRTNLNAMLLNNSVYQSLNGYGSQFAYIRGRAVLNGDKVFWERRTDSLLYHAQITVNSEATSVLNDFKLKDFTDLFVGNDTASGTAFLNNSKVQVHLPDSVSASCIYLYDNPDRSQNILAGYISFDDGSRIDFGELNKDGSATVISFPEKQIRQFEIVPTGTEGEYAGLNEIELYHNSVGHQTETYLMAVDQDDNFVYDYIVPKGDTVAFSLRRFPHAEQTNRDDITLAFESNDADSSYIWDNETLTVTCVKGSTCTITVSDDNTSTTFTVSNPSALTRTYLTVLRSMEELTVDIRYLVFGLHQVYYRLVG